MVVPNTATMVSIAALPRLRGQTMPSSAAGQSTCTSSTTPT